MQHPVLQWLVNNWELVAGVAYGLVVVINAVTKHHSLQDSKWKQKLLWVAEMLSFLSSKEVAGWVWKLKAPLQDRKPASSQDVTKPDIPSGLVGVLLIVIPLGFGCGSWQQNMKTGLGATFDVAKTFDGISNQYYHKKCMDIAKACRVMWESAPTSQPATCPDLVVCQAVKHSIEDKVVALYHGVAAGLLAIQLGQKEEAQDWVDKVKKLLEHVQGMAKSSGLWDVVTKALEK